MKLNKPNIYVVEGLSGGGKTTVADLIARAVNGKKFNGDVYLFEYIKNNPKIMKNIFGHGVDGLSGFEYFIKYCLRSIDQYVELLKNANPYIEENIYNKVQSDKKLHKQKQLIFDYATSSTMFPWNGEPAIKILVEAPELKRSQALISREHKSGLKQGSIEVLFQGQQLLINPKQADIVLPNEFISIEDLRKRIHSDIINI